jgi:hypothetical protein
MTSTFAGKPVTTEEIRGTLRELGYYRRFLESSAAFCRDPWDYGRQMNRGEARHRLALMVNRAINRKAGVPDARGRKQESDYQWALRRDANRVEDRLRRRVRIYQFETKDVRGRLGHLLSEYDD